MIRLILIVIFAIIIIFASLIMLPVFWLIGKFNQMLRIAEVSALCRVFLRLFFFCLVLQQP